MHLNFPLIISIMIFPINKIFELEINEHKMYYILTTWSFIMLFWFIINTLYQITDYLDVDWWKSPE